MKYSKKSLFLFLLIKYPTMLLLHVYGMLKVILNEIGVFGHGNNTFCQANESCDEIIDENTEYTKRLGFIITDKEKSLPIINWIPKIYKNPTGAHWILI